MSKYFTLLALILTMAPGWAFAASCDFLPATPQPDWINGARTLPGYYLGVGVASKSAKGSDFQLEKSQQDAIRDLSENIEVTIKSQLTIRQSSDDSTSFSSEEAESLIVTSSNASLQNVLTDKVWLDRNSCLVWTRVKISKAIVEAEADRQQESARVLKLQGLIDAADSSTADTEAALEKLELASVLLAYIDFSLIDADSQKAEFSLRIKQITENLKTRSKTSESAQNLFLRAREQLQLARTDTANKKQHENDALNSYRRIVTEFPFGGDANRWSEKASFEIATIELQRNNPCAAQVQLSKIKDSSSDSQWVLKSRKLLRKARCSEQDRIAYNFRNMFDAKRVNVECHYRLNNPVAWENVCDKIVSHFNSNGAIAARYNAKGKDTPSAFRIQVTSSGNLNTRDSAGKIEYQFQGDISTRMTNGSQLILEDNYSGIGGWNPVSERMAMEVLGIHVFKRFIKALNREIEG
ncbi:LPP20 family lipoprotein [Gammaproteobacteria bacterium]|nr:LPP20 family lipoprotein [Gammaproteobacteria bacterium]